MEPTNIACKKFFRSFSNNAKTKHFEGQYANAKSHINLSELIIFASKINWL